VGGINVLHGLSFNDLCASSVSSRSAAMAGAATLSGSVVPLCRALSMSVLPVEASK
jgi:hypothetical protein